MVQSYCQNQPIVHRCNDATTSLSTQTSTSCWLTGLVTTFVVVGASTLFTLLLMHVIIPLAVACVQRRKEAADDSVASKDQDVPSSMSTHSDDIGSSTNASADQSSTATQGSSIMSALRGGLAAWSSSAANGISGSVHRYVVGLFLYTLQCFAYQPCIQGLRYLCTYQDSQF